MVDGNQVSGRPRAARIRATILALVIAMAVIGLGTLFFALEGKLSIKVFEETILSLGAWGVGASIGIMVLHSFVPFPAELVAFANGMIYGPFWGTVITWTGAMLGGLLAFGLARFLGRPFVEIIVDRKNWHVLDEWTAERGGRLVFISRFIPIIAFNLVNYAAGLTRISWWTFIWATGLGILPLTALMVFMGDRIENITGEMWLLSGAAVIVLWVVFRRRFPG